MDYLNDTNLIGPNSVWDENLLKQGLPFYCATYFGIFGWRGLQIGTLTVFLV